MNEKRQQQSDKTYSPLHKTSNFDMSSQIYTYPKAFRNWHQMPHRLMYQTGATVGEKTSNQQKVTATQDTTALTSPPKIALRHEPPDLRQSQATAFISIKFRIDWHQIPHRLMYHTGVTVGQKTSNQQKVTATQTTSALTSAQKIELRHKPPDLRQSKGIAGIGIECRID